MSNFRTTLLQIIIISLLNRTIAYRTAADKPQIQRITDESMGQISWECIIGENVCNFIEITSKTSQMNQTLCTKWNFLFKEIPKPVAMKIIKKTIQFSRRTTHSFIFRFHLRHRVTSNEKKKLNLNLLRGQ